MTRAAAFALALLAAAVALGPAGRAAAQSAPAAAEEPSRSRLAITAYQEGIAARDEGRFADYLRAMDRALALAPGQPVLMLHLARACALTGDRDGAAAWLVRIAATGAQHDVAADVDLATLADLPAYVAAVEEMARQAEPQGVAEVAFRIAEPDFLPEGIAHDPLTGDFYVGSIWLRKIVRIDAQGNVTDFVPSARDGLWSVVGMKVDESRRRLWACSGASGMMLGGSPSDTTHNGLFAFDLESGRLVTKAIVADTTRRREMNDCAIAPDGSVYATDSRNGSIWVLRPDSDRLEMLIGDDVLSGSNGITLSRDGALLYVAEYNLGIAVINLATLAIDRLQAPEEFCTVYVDGLDWCERSLIAVQNGRGLDRVARFFLDESGRRVVGMTVLAARLKEFDEPTTGCVAGRSYFFVASSEVHRLRRDGAPEPADPPRDFLIMRAALQ